MSRDNRRISKKELTKLFNRYQLGERIIDIAFELNMKPNTLSCKFKNAGLMKEFRSPNSKLPFDEIYNDHVQNGILYNDLCQKYKISYKNLRNGLRHFGYPSDKERIIFVNLPKSWERYMAGELQADLAKEYGITPKALSGRFSKEGFRKKRNIDNYKFEDIVKKLKEVGSLKAVAQEFELNYNVILRWFSQQGLSARGYKIKNHDFFKDINTPEKAYFLGFIYADGYVYEPDNFLRIKINSRDKHILEKLVTYLYRGNKEIKEWFEEGRKVCSLSVSSKQMISDLKDWGVTQNKTFTIKFPAKLSLDMTRHFIRGFFDGDGWVSKVGSNKFGDLLSVGFCSGSDDFIIALREILLSIGLHPHKIGNTINTSSNNKCYKFSISRRAEIVFLKKYFYQEVDKELYLTRKYKVFKNIDPATANPHIGKHSILGKKVLSQKAKERHKQGLYEKYQAIKCELIDAKKRISVAEESIKKACRRMQINYDSARMFFYKYPNELFLNRYKLVKK